MKAFFIVIGIVIVAAGYKYGPDLYVKGVREKNRVMAKISEPFDERKADVHKLNKLHGTDANGNDNGNAKQSTNDMLKQMKQQKKDLRK